MEYDRKILVPYLTELYGLEVTYQSLKNKSSKYSKLVEKEEYNVSQSYMLNEIIKAPNTKIPQSWLYSLLIRILFHKPSYQS